MSGPVRRTGLGATTCVSRRGTCGVTIIACWEHHFFLANRERFGARFDLLRPLFLDNDITSEDTVERTLRLIRINSARAVARSLTFNHKLMMRMRVVRLSVILQQQSRLSSGTQQCRLYSQSRLGCVQLIQAKSASSDVTVKIY